MEGALAWISEAIRWIGQLIPRWVIIAPTHAGVKFVWGRNVKALAAGWWIYWPLSTELHTYPIARQTIPTRPQGIVTADDKTIEVAGMITYRIHDVVAILARTYDPDNTIEETSMCAIGRICCRLSWDDLKAGRETGRLDKVLRAEVRRELRPYGVTVDKATLTDLVPCRVNKLILTTAQGGQ